MAIKRKSSELKKLEGNRSRRHIPEEMEVPVAAPRCPSGLSKTERKYWKIWAPALIEIGKLTVMTLPSFLDFVTMKSRLNEVNVFLRENNCSLLQEDTFVDSSGQEHKKFKESAYSKLSRDLSVTVHRLEKSWGLTGDSMAGLFKAKQKKDKLEGLLD